MVGLFMIRRASGRKRLTLSWRRRARAVLTVGSSGLLVVALIQIAPAPAGAATTSAVSLTFDGNTISQYNLGYLQALQPHGAHGTFFIQSGTVGSSANFMSWAQLATVAGAGNDIGGKSVNATNLTTDPNPTPQVCNDRSAILAHGLTPVGFAYPGGANNATVQGIVKNCQYGSARTVGGLSPTGQTWAETQPPVNWFATRAYAPGAVTLANMQALVNGAASHGGGWSQIVIGKVCSQSLDPSNYTACSASSGHIELADLNTFLDWMANAGQVGGAPAGALLGTVGAAVASADTGAPTTTISCNGAACANTPYSGIVTVTLAPTDVGSGVASTHFTIDGTDPTLTSPTYTGPFSVNGSNSSTTVKFRSWDLAGNVETIQTQVIQAPPDTAAPITTIACNAAACGTAPYVATVSVTLSATDTGGSGLAATYYTTDGSTPTTSGPAYSGPVTLNTPGTYQVKFFSTDRAGNAEAVQTQQVVVVPVTTKVSLTFDNGSVAQYTLAYQQALQPHNANATFFVNSGTVGGSANIMTWTQLSTLAAAGNDIGGKSVNSANLTTDPNATAQVCNDRTALLQHGLKPVAFAYPGGAFTVAVEDIVKNCGYGSARTAGSVSPNGPTYAEKLPPTNWYATRAYAPGGQITLAIAQSLVTGAATHGGGWTQLVIGRVCSQSADPANYTACTASAGWIELADLNAFLDWMGNAGQAGGAPGGAALSTVRDAAIGADTIAPVTTIACNGTTCAPDVYTSTVYVTLPSTDVGSAVASTHYTTDGSDPTLSSPTYSTPIPVTSTTTIKYRSWDNAGNTDPIGVQNIQANLPPDSTPPATTIACGGSPCAAAGYNGSTVVTLSATDNGGWGVDKTYYTTDGTAPTTSSTVYTGPITLSTPATYNVKFFSTDLAGNAEPVHSQQIIVLAPSVVVSLTFDDGIQNQLTLGVRRALQPHHLQGTFYNISGLNGVDPQHMTWAELAAVNEAGNEIGGHTVDHVNLKTDPDTAHKTYEVCQDRQNLIDHGFYPTSFAYPEGAYDATAEGIVASCGYATGRAAGGIDVAGDGAGPVYAETIQPKDAYATRTVYDPVGNGIPITLAHLKASVTAAGAHGGGWVPIVIHQICSQTFDPDEYAGCTSDYGPIELDVFNAFLDWLQSSAAPPRTSVQTVSQIVNGPDMLAPISTLTCDGAPCQSSTYGGSTTVTFARKDPGGSGAAATYYTTDGTTPTTSSTLATLPLLINQTTTFKFFSVDNAGNVEAVQTQQVVVTPNADPVIGTAGDIACDPLSPAFNNGQGTDTDCRAASTAKLLTGLDAVLPLGDNQYDCGGTAAWAQSYGPTWGVLKPITHPVPGDADYATTGGTDCPTTAGAGYYQYFGAAAGDPTKGYYSYNLGQWHMIALNTAPCVDNPTTCAAGSAQDLWLQQDLAANTSACTLAYFQTPRWASAASGGTGDDTFQPFWQDLYNGGTDVVLNGDSHWYERFAQLNAAGAQDPARGVREFIVGTGGQGLDTPGAAGPNSEALNATTHGILRMTLHANSYNWGFVPDEGTFTDAGTATCHGKPDPVAPVTTAACNGAACSAAWYTNTVQATLLPTDNAGGSGVDKTYYTTDGSTPTTASTVYAAPISVASTSTLKYFSVDKAGNSEAVKSQLIQIDSLAPTSTISCNNTACAAAYRTAVTVAFTSTDGAGGSGVAGTYYTTDGSTPTTASTRYTAPFTVASTATVKFFSADTAGNAEAVKSQVIQLDTGVPTTTISCNGAACGAGWYTSVQATLVATDDVGGSGVDKTYYTTNGTTPTTASPVYTTPIVLPATATVQFFSVDKAGNSEAVKSQLIRVDSSAPTTTIRCNNAACAASYFSTVSVSFTSTDGTGGSGVSSTHYTKDGSDPSLSSPTYTAAFAVTATTTVKFRSWDVAGNIEATRSQVIAITADQPPVAVLTVTPSSGLAPLSVTANASGSTDTDPTPINNYSFNFGDGSAAVSGTASSRTHNYTTTGTFTVTVTVRDTAGLTGSASKQVISQANLAAANPGFESSTTGWATGSTSVSLSRQLGGHSGSWSGRVQNTGTGARTCALTDSPNWVARTAAGTYTASLWVKGAAAGATLTWQVKEMNGATVVRTASTTIRLTTGWQQIKLTYSALQPGVTALDFNASVPAVAANATAFYADDAVVVLG
jgi:peptidoglycan/xylan/chitin deacetylase (PgdA/CDA1 family)